MATLQKLRKHAHTNTLLYVLAGYNKYVKLIPRSYY